MKIYDKMGKEHATVDEALAAEKEYDEAVAKEKARKENLAKERKDRAAEVEEAYKVVLEAQKVYKAKLDAFIEDYHSFHTTIKSDDPNLFSIFFPFF